MNDRLSRHFLAAALAAGLVSSAHASDGYFSHGYGTAQKSLAGAGAALCLNTLSPATNPATLACVGARYDVGLAIFNPNREYSVSGSPSGFPGTFGLAPGTVKSGSTVFPVPSLGGSWAIGRDGVLGVAIYGNGGMNTSYAAPTFGVAPAGVDMAQMFLAPTYAHRIAGSKHSVGVSAILAYQRFEARGLQAFGPFSSDAAHLTNMTHANSFGVGARFGYRGEILPWLSLGASYQTRVGMSAFDEYSGLFAEKGAFDIPQNVTGGIAVKPADAFTIVFDVQWIDYTSVRSVGNDFLPNLALSPLGADAGAGFGWHDMTVYKAGLQWEASRDWTLRAGYSYGREPIRGNEVVINILAPGVMEQHVTAGFTRAMGKGKAVNFSIMRALPKAISGPNNLEAPDQQTIELKMHQWEFDVSYSFGF
jgi:long-chain fatty acid transport protein